VEVRGDRSVGFAPSNVKWTLYRAGLTSLVLTMAMPLNGDCRKMPVLHIQTGFSEQGSQQLERVDQAADSVIELGCRLAGMIS